MNVEHNLKFQHNLLYLDQQLHYNYKPMLTRGYTMVSQ